MHFEWDSSKSLSNQKKHGMNFGRAKEVFTDPNQVSVFENTYGEEDRWKTIGFTTELTLLVVVYMFPFKNDVELVRIISARPATRTERKLYAIENGSLRRK